MSGWTDEQIAQLRKLASEGLSSGQLMKALKTQRPGLTRSAVIGALRRHEIPLLGKGPSWAKPKQPKRLAPPPKPTATPSAKPRNRRDEHSYERLVTVSAPPPAAEPVRANAFDILQSSRPLLLMKRKANQCAWPVGEPPSPSEQLCCGAPVASSADGAPPYCKAHMALRRGKPWKPIKIGRVA